MVDFIELHAHSEFSNLRLIDCVIKVENLIEEAYKSGLKGVAITDHESLSGHIRAIKKAKTMNKDFKVILGNEIYLVDSFNKQEKYWHFLLLAKNKKGYEQLKALSSEAWRNSFFDRGMERTVTNYDNLKKIIGNDKGNIIGSTACLGSEFANLVKKFNESQTVESKKDIDKFIKWNLDIFGKDFYIELQASSTQEQIDYNKTAIKIANGYKIKYIITNDIHYIKKEDRSIHEAFLKSKEGDRELEDFYKSTYLKTSDDVILSMKDYISEKDILIGIENTMEIYSKIQPFDLKHEMEIPEREIKEVNLKHIFKEFYKENPYLEKFSNSKSLQDKFLLEEIERGFLEKKQQFNSKNIARLNEELGYLWEISLKLKKNMSAYYITMESMIDIIWDDSGGDSLLGVARGSITGMYFAYLIDIIQINPLDFDIPAWRHIHPSRPELPKQ